MLGARIGGDEPRRGSLVRVVPRCCDLRSAVVDRELNLNGADDAMRRPVANHRDRRIERRGGDRLPDLPAVTQPDLEDPRPLASVALGGEDPAPALAAPGTARERLELALAAECALTEANLALLEAFGGAGRDAIYHEGEAPARTRAAFVGPYRRLLRDGLEDGTLAVADPDEAATVLINLVGHTYRHLRTGHGWSPERARAAICAIALDGVATR